ncbi:hypothetical protein H6G97_51520 [Nostoc flagelliforme FACHB-838]|uniref:Uncharacterized protein n=1 Tax=Nostoc flagelliforme FACHB-838 TaxID=2692904 RepID=A0ABR8E600_9NOSO|nr:hypothetical protein [Nostoc flagelliforme]MBD2537167.1 hypothetical protein [Nostoc flagelliforme FACHB-838]
MKIFLSTIVYPSEKVFLRSNDILIGKNAGENTTTAIIDRIIHLGWKILVELGLRTAEYGV